jgi:hypothetical protein
MERIKILENYIHHNFGIKVTLNVTTTMVSSNIKAMEGCDKLTTKVLIEIPKNPLKPIIQLPSSIMR